MTSSERDEPRVVVVERRESSLFPFLFGTAIGALLGILYAPRSGEETRRTIEGWAQSLRDQAGESLEDAVTEARRQVGAGLSAARRAVEDQAAEVREVLEAGRAAAQQTREELRRRRAEPPGASSGSEPKEPKPAKS